MTTKFQRANVQKLINMGNAELIAIVEKHKSGSKVDSDLAKWDNGATTSEAIAEYLESIPASKPKKTVKEKVVDNG